MFDKTTADRKAAHSGIPGVSLSKCRNESGSPLARLERSVSPPSKRLSAGPGLTVSRSGLRARALQQCAFNLCERLPKLARGYL